MGEVRERYRTKTIEEYERIEWDHFDRATKNKKKKGTDKSVEIELDWLGESGT